MKRLNVAFLFAFAASFIFLQACTDVESLADGSQFSSVTDPTLDPHPVTPPEPGTPEFVRAQITQDKDKANFVALREFKAKPGIPQVFVWFDNWSGKFDTGDASMRGLPDSVTIASNWGGHPKFYWEEFKNDPSKSLSDIRRADMEYVQQVKGTKVVVTLFSEKCGDDMLADPAYNISSSETAEAVIRPAIKKYAKAIYDAVIASGYDGFDWDFEPGYGGSTTTSPLWYNQAQKKAFMEELTYWFGTGAMDVSRARGDRPMPTKPLLLLVDGAVHDPTFKMDYTYYVNYYVQQAYGVSSVSGANSRVQSIVNQLVDHITAGKITTQEAIRRCILTENFESYANTGGGVLVQSALVCTNINPGAVEHQVGGFGLYRGGLDYQGDAARVYAGSQNWYWLRRGISNLYNVYNQRQTAGKDIYPN